MSGTRWASIAARERVEKKFNAKRQAERLAAIYKTILES